MANHFRAVGLAVDGEEDLARLEPMVMAQGRRYRHAVGTLVWWSPGKGVELWVGLSKDGGLICMNPHYLGSGRVHVREEKFVVDPACPFCHSFSGWYQGGEDGGRWSDLCPLVVELPELSLGAKRSEHQSVLQVAAFGERLRCFPDVTSYDATQTGTARYGPGTIIPVGHFADPAEISARGRPRAEVLMVGIASLVETVRSPAGGPDFLRLQVGNNGNLFDVVAEPSIVSGTPAVGGVIEGLYWLSGRFVTPQ